MCMPQDDASWEIRVGEEVFLSFEKQKNGDAKENLEKGKTASRYILWLLHTLFSGPILFSDLSQYQYRYLCYSKCLHLY